MESGLVDYRSTCFCGKFILTMGRRMPCMPWLYSFMGMGVAHDFHLCTDRHDPNPDPAMMDQTSLYTLSILVILSYRIVK